MKQLRLYQRKNIIVYSSPLFGHTYLSIHGQCKTSPLMVFLFYWFVCFLGSFLFMLKIKITNNISNPSKTTKNRGGQQTTMQMTLHLRFFKDGCNLIAKYNISFLVNYLNFRFSCTAISHTSSKAFEKHSYYPLITSAQVLKAHSKNIYFLKCQKLIQQTHLRGSCMYAYTN